MSRAVTITSLTLLFIACKSASQGSPCMEIPDGGCPLTSGANVCTDATCAAVYACNGDGTWSLDHVCPPDDASVVDAYVSVQDASNFVQDATIDVPGANGGPGCVDLEAPDCPAGLALDCPASSGCCGCEDLFVCTDEQWVPWGECYEDGGVVPN